jgi:hypothetical protein
MEKRFLKRPKKYTPSNTQPTWYISIISTLCVVCLFNFVYASTKLAELFWSTFNNFTSPWSLIPLFVYGSLLFSLSFVGWIAGIWLKRFTSVLEERWLGKP